MWWQPDQSSPQSPPQGDLRDEWGLSIPAVVLIQVHDVHTLPMEAVVLHFRLASRYPNLCHTWAVLCLDCKDISLAPWDVGNVAQRKMIPKGSSVRLPAQGRREPKTCYFLRAVQYLLSAVVQFSISPGPHNGITVVPRAACNR